MTMFTPFAPPARASVLPRLGVYPAAISGTA